MCPELFDQGLTHRVILPYDLTSISNYVYQKRPSQNILTIACKKDKQSGKM